MRAPVFALALAVVAASFGSVGCDKLGLGKKDADGGAASASGGGVLSFLDSAFEGAVTMNVSSKGSAPKSAVLNLKTPRVRVDLGPELAPGNPMLAQGVALIINPPAKKGYALINAQKQAIVIDFDKSKGGFKPPSLGGPSAPSAPSEPPPKIEKTGKKDTVAGYTCEIWKITSKDGHAEACLADKIKWIDLTDLAVQSPAFAAIAAVSDFNHLPLRVVSFDAKNAEEGRLEVTKVDKKTVPDSEFTVPTGFAIVDMNQFLASMMGGMGAAGRPGVRPGMPPGLPAGFVPPKPKH